MKRTIILCAALVMGVVFLGIGSRGPAQEESGEAIEKSVKEVLDLPPKAEQLLASIIGR